MIFCYKFIFLMKVNFYMIMLNRKKRYPTNQILPVEWLRINRPVRNEIIVSDWNWNT